MLLSSRIAMPHNKVTPNVGASPLHPPDCLVIIFPVIGQSPKVAVIPAPWAGARLVDHSAFQPRACRGSRNNTRSKGPSDKLTAAREPDWAMARFNAMDIRKLRSRLNTCGEAKQRNVCLARRWWAREGSGMWVADPEVMWVRCELGLQGGHILAFANAEGAYFCSTTGSFVSCQICPFNILQSWC